MRGCAAILSLPIAIMLLAASCGEEPTVKNAAGTSLRAAETPALYARMRIDVVQTTGLYRDNRMADGSTQIVTVEEHSAAPVGADVWIAGGEQSIAMVQLPEGRRMTFLLREVTISPEAVKTASYGLFVNFEWETPGIPGGSPMLRGGWAESPALAADKYTFPLNRPIELYRSDQPDVNVGQEVYSMLSMRATATLVEVRTIEQIKEDHSGPVLPMGERRVGDAAGNAGPALRQQGADHRRYVVQRLVKAVPTAAAAAVVEFQSDTRKVWAVEGGVVAKKEVPMAETLEYGEKGKTVFQIRGTFSLDRMIFGDEHALPELGHVAADVQVEPRWMGNEPYRRLVDLVQFDQYRDLGPRRFILLTPPPPPGTSGATRSPASRPAVSIIDCSFFGPIQKEDADEVVQVVRYIREHPAPTRDDGEALLRRDGEWFRELGREYRRILER